jgi:glycosyltransferase involved in cell wall biosynthesis
MAELEYPPWDTFRPGQRRRWYRLETRLYQQASLIFARSTRMKRSLVDFYKVDPEKVLVVGAGINYGSWPKHPKKYDSQMLLFVGKDFVRKGGPGLLEALDLVRRQIPEAHLTIAGPKEPVRRDGVQFLGRVNDRKRLQQLYTKATLFVMPSIYEPWGNVYTEAMAHKLPCIGTHVGGVPDIIVDGETGYLVPPNQPQILADRILRLLRNPDMAREMGERGYRRAMQEFTWDRVVERMQPHLDHLMISQKP